MASKKNVSVNTLFVLIFVAVIAVSALVLGSLLSTKSPVAPTVPQVKPEAAGPSQRCPPKNIICKDLPNRKTCLGKQAGEFCQAATGTDPSKGNAYVTGVCTADWYTDNCQGSNPCPMNCVPVVTPVGHTPMPPQTRPRICPTLPGGGKPSICS